MAIPFTGAIRADLKLNFKKIKIMSIVYIVVMLVVFLVYNIFFNKKKPSNGYGIDMGPFIRGMISLVLYLISWIAWFIIF